MGNLLFMCFRRWERRLSTRYFVPVLLERTKGNWFFNATSLNVPVFRLSCIAVVTGIHSPCAIYKCLYASLFVRSVHCDRFGFVHGYGDDDDEVMLNVLRCWLTY